MYLLLEYDDFMLLLLLEVDFGSTIKRFRGAVYNYRRLSEAYLAQFVVTLSNPIVTIRLRPLIII